MLKLVGTDGTRLYSWPLEPGTHSVGRSSSDSAFAVSDRTVSRKHANIEVSASGQGCYVTDLGSRNGTFVNGERLTARTAICDGDHIAFGDVEFKVTGEQADRTVISRPDTVPLSERDPEKSVYLSINEALSPLPAKVTDLPDVLPTLFDMAKILVLPEPKEAMLERALKLVSRVIPSERLAVLTTDPDREGEVVTAACLRPVDKDPGSFTLSKTIVDEILTEKSSIVISDPQDDPRFAQQESIIMSQLKSAMAVPLFDGGVVLGLLYVDTTNPVHRYNDDYLRLLATFGNLIASRLLNYELLHERQEKQMFEAELKRASSIQTNLLTREIPPVDGYQLDAIQEQCRRVGGDLYDMALLPDGRLIFVVADVSGKGMGGALLMSNILASFRILYAEPDFGLTKVVGQVSRQLFKYSASEDFATLFIGLLDPAQNVIRYLNAGHNPPMLVRAGGEVELLEPSGIMIGAFDFCDWTESTIDMSPGDQMLIFTDGVTEADKQGEFYGEERLQALVTQARNMSPDKLVNCVMEDVIGFIGDSPRSDDITMLAIKRV